MTSLLRFFFSRTMGFKLTFIFLAVILVPMVMLAYISYRVIDSRLLGEAEQKIGMGLKAAWTEYYARGAQMRYGMLQASSMEEIKGAISRRDSVYLKKMMVRWKHMRPYVDIWAITDGNGRVIVRLNSDYAGDKLDVNGSLAVAMASGEPSISSEILTREALKFEGNEIMEDVGSSYVAATDASGSGEAGADTEFLALMVVTPVLDNARRPLGAIITGDVLNNDDHIPSSVASRIPGFFTTVSMGPKRITTNLMDDSGRNLKGTKLPDNVIDGLGAGKVFFGAWIVDNMDFISAFEPIKDFSGKVIGSLDVGMPREKLWAVQRENQKVIVLITFMGLSFSLMAAFLSTREITRPLKDLKDKISAYAGGDMSVRVKCNAVGPTNDELTILARTFNSMMDEVGRREADKERYLAATEEKNREFTRLNDELKIKNEEIEVAYEETQSQTEELHAINEELKLLNEDLDRKNAELKRANRIITQEEEELKRAKDKLRFIYDSIRDFILLVDYDHRIVEANRCFAETFKTVEPALINGRDIFEVMGLELPPAGSPLRLSIDTMRPVESELTNKAGNIFTLHSYPFIDSRSETGQAVVYIRDITEERMMTHKLIQAEKLSSLGELVSGVAHELNNPLTGIMCYSELLMEDNISSDVNDKLKKINDASHRCKKIIDNLLTFARWRMPEKTFEDVNAIIRESSELRAYQMKMDDVEIDLDLDSNLPFTMLDESQIHQVFLNLINNASDAIQETGGKGRISIRSSSGDGMIVVEVEDSGAGASDEIVNRMFDPFFTTKEVGKGTGLGLSISYGIINEHGGNIYASSRPGKGTTFVVELPVISQTGEWSKKPLPGVSVDLKEKAGGLNALILDDEPMVLDLLRETLTGLDFRVDKTNSGEEAIEMIRRNDYGLIISDIRMPGIDGKSFCNEIKNIKPELVKNIIFISGDTLNNDTQTFLRESGNHALKKPFTVDQLKYAISKVLC